MTGSAWVEMVSSRTTVVAASDDLPLLLGHFRCEPGDPAWGEINRIGDIPHVVFPRAAVRIRPERGGPVTADANRVLLYGPGQQYRRGMLDPRGDDCLFLALGPEVIARVGGSAVAEHGVLVDTGLRERSCPADVWTALHQIRAAASAAHHDELAVDELLLTLVEEVLGGPRLAPDPDDVAPVVEEVRAVLTQRTHDRMTLDDVAAAVGASPYHLHRQFRAATGWTIHAYRDHLRLREGLARVLDGESDLSVLAFDLGYSSHSHFTSRFRRAFGVTPSQVRRDRRLVGRR